MIQVILADDHSIVRAGLRRIVEEDDEMIVIAEADNGKSALKKAVEKQPDVLVIDISMPGMDGLEVISQLQDQAPDIGCIVLTMYEEEQYVVRAFETGAMAYITKKSAPEQLVDAIRKVDSGARYLTGEIAEMLARRLARGNADQSPLDTLSNREMQVLRRLAMGNTNREIAEAYNISVKTVDTYRFRLLRKLHLRNNADISRFAIQNRLIEA